MSQYISPEREEVYRQYGLEDALQDRVFSPGEEVALRERPDGFGHNVLMLWVQGEEGVHINVDGIDVSVPGETANAAFDHVYPLIERKIGEEALHYLTQPQESTAEAA